MGRDLVKEMEERRAEAASTAASSLAMPASPKGPHPAASNAKAAANALLAPTAKTKSCKVDEDPWQVREDVAGAVFSDMDSVIVVDVGNDLQDSIISSDNAELVVACEALKGSYFFTGQYLNGYPVWKQIAPCVHSADQLCWFVMGEGHGTSKPIGWYCADAVFSSEKDMHKVAKHIGRDVVIHAWGACAAGGNWPEEVHFPWWEKARAKDIIVDSLWTSYNLALLRIAELESELEDGQHRSADEPMATGAKQPSHPPPYKGKGSKGSGKHGGWMPKIAQLICAIKASDWAYMQKLIDRFVSGSDALKNLVKQKLKIKKGKDKGKGSQQHDGSDLDDDDDADL
jgi:hypothetical protein